MNCRKKSINLICPGRCARKNLKEYLPVSNETKITSRKEIKKKEIEPGGANGGKASG